MTEYNWRNARPVKARHKDGGREGTTAGKEEMLARLREYFRIYFPTEETVVNSKGGPKVSIFMFLFLAQRQAQSYTYMLTSNSQEAPSVFNPNGTLRRSFREAYYAIARAAGMECLCTIRSLVFHP